MCIERERERGGRGEIKGLIEIGWGGGRRNGLTKDSIEKAGS